ncbi:MAG: pyridoxal phosphate-dependent aminotransferase [Chloroflexi bacterium]|nr:pyridoxal phosphate-dependent aminotransferase [Chloroflexota bacterium]
MSFDFDTLPNRRNNESIKWQRYNEDVLPLWVADMDFRSPEPVIQALRKRVEHGVFGYPWPPEGSKEAVVEWLARRYGWEVTPDDLIFVPGVVTGFHLAAHAVTRPGDGVLVQTPTYGPFFKVAGNVHLVQQEMELTRGADGQYSIDMEAFESAINGRTRIFMLCNPQNPTGRVFRADELEQMAEICLRHDVTICSDEIHGDLVYSESKHIPIASLAPEIAANTITMLAPSKTFNIAGLEASVAVIQNKELRKKFEGAGQGLVGWVNLLGQIAALAAYRDGEPWLDALLKYLESNRDYLYAFVQHELPGISMAKPEGTFLAWLDCSQAAIEGQPDKYFLAKARVAMNDGEWFGKGGAGFVRLNFGCPRSMLVDALGRMKMAMEK